MSPLATVTKNLFVEIYLFVCHCQILIFSKCNKANNIEYIIFGGKVGHKSSSMKYFILKCSVFQFNWKYCKTVHKAVQNLKKPIKYCVINIEIVWNLIKLIIKIKLKLWKECRTQPPLVLKVLEACVFSRRQNGQQSHWMCIYSLLKISQNITSNPHLTTLSSA